MQFWNVGLRPQHWLRYSPSYVAKLGDCDPRSYSWSQRQYYLGNARGLASANTWEAALTRFLRRLAFDLWPFLRDCRPIPRRKSLSVGPYFRVSARLGCFPFCGLAVFLGVLSGIGSGVRWYRAILLEEVHKDLCERREPKSIRLASVASPRFTERTSSILTGIVVLLPLLFMGSLIMESFFGIPGLGSYVIEAIAQQDFAIVRVMVYLGSLLYIVGLLLTDLRTLGQIPEFDSLRGKYGVERYRLIFRGFCDFRFCNASVSPRRPTRSMEKNFFSTYRDRVRNDHDVFILGLPFLILFIRSIFAQDNARPCWIVGC